MTRFDWGEAGRALGPSLDRVHALVVLGADPDATTEVALGIGRAQAMRRRVAVGELFGEAAPIERLLTGDDPHGLVDSFVYGVSLSRIARPVLGERNLFVMPAGSEPPEYGELLPNPRWRRLASGFREVDALLVVAAPAYATGVDALVAQCDGAILVGEMVPAKLSVSRVLTSVRAPRHGAPAAAGVTGKVPEAGEAVGEAGAPRAARAMRLVAGTVLAAILGGMGLWFASRPLDRTGPRPAPGRPDSTGAQAQQLLPITDSARAAAADSIAADSAAAASAMAIRLEPVNPADSLSAAGFGVELVALNTPAGAILKLREQGGAVPAATMAPILVDGGRWYRVVGGAFADRRGADSLLASMRTEGRIDERTGQVVRLPLAFLLQSGLAADSARSLVTGFAARGIPAYALRQPDGRVHVYAGAFATADEAVLLADLMAAAALVPTLAYRIGRSF